MITIAIVLVMITQRTIYNSKNSNGNMKNDNTNSRSNNSNSTTDSKQSFRPGKCSPWHQGWFHRALFLMTTTCNPTSSPPASIGPDDQGIQSDITPIMENQMEKKNRK